MKRWNFLLVVMLLLALVFVGCSAEEADSTSKDDSSSTETASSSGEDSLPAQVQEIVDRGVLKVGVKVDVPNFGYQNPETNEVEGFEIDLAKAIAKEMFGDENKIETQAVTAKTRGPLLDSGEVDAVIATFTITDERKLSYNFSTPYYTDAVGLLVKKDGGYKSLKDLDGKTIGVAQSATSKDAIQAEAEKLGIQVKFLEFASYPEIKTALTSGRVDAFAVDRSILAGYVDDQTEILPDKFNPQDYGIAIKLDNKELAEYVDGIIVEMKDSGELDKLKSKWDLE